ncbi:hypothetical protein GCM10009583_08480 [Ornithinicoccus hortensis]|uniref:Uncharacterized protein n=2 Tax=Ornithinicoccus hortensis TaxID=82346 RepID=A0A542YWN8_9MICO|nr:hypothetical protein FB467_3684 [Ornithinicoccus hortensis]
MFLRSDRARRRTVRALAATMALGAALAGSAPAAQAHSNVWADYDTRKTSSCPCTLWDEYDGTYFQHDQGGKAARGRIYSGNELVGKMEFHPRGEEIWVYDTKANGDAIYWQIELDGYRGPIFRLDSGQRYGVYGGLVAENLPIKVYAYDDLASDGSGKNLMATISGTT